MTASQPRGPSSELRTETMVLAIARSESEMWIGGKAREAVKEQGGGVKEGEEVTGKLMVSDMS